MLNFTKTKLSEWKFLLVGAAIGALALTLIPLLKPKPTPSTPLPQVVQKISSPSAIKTISATQSAKPKTQESIPAALQGPSSPNGIPILMYHYVGNNPNPTDRQRDILSIAPDKLEAQFQWLSQNGYTPITLDTLYGVFYKKEDINKPIVLTFDDGYIDFYVNAFQILKKYNYHAVSFIPTGLIGTSYYMSWDQIKEINNSGLVSFQAHTINHLNLPSLSYSDKLYQLVTSKKTLEQQTGKTVNFIAYPYGASDPETWRAALSAGFVGGVGTWLGKSTGPGINMPRIRISGNISPLEFAKKVGQ